MIQGTLTQGPAFIEGLHRSEQASYPPESMRRRQKACAIRKLDPRVVGRAPCTARRNEVRRRILSRFSGSWRLLLFRVGTASRLLSRLLLSSLRGLDLYPLCYPATTCRAFRVSPLRGWRNGSVHFFCGPSGCGTDSPRPSKPSEQQLGSVSRRSSPPRGLFSPRPAAFQNHYPRRPDFLARIFTELRRAQYYAPSISSCRKPTASGNIEVDVKWPMETGPSPRIPPAQYDLLRLIAVLQVFAWNYMPAAIALT